MIITKKQICWTDALLISQEPWAAGLNMPGAPPTERNLLYNKMYELPKLRSAGLTLCQFLFKKRINLSSDSLTLDSGEAAALTEFVYQPVNQFE